MKNKVPVKFRKMNSKAGIRLYQQNGWDDAKNKWKVENKEMFFQ